MSPKYFVILLIILVPVWANYLRPGFFFIHDEPHLLRLYEYHQCWLDRQFPCIWSANTSNGYGQPLFMFYGPMPYIIGETIHLLGFGFISTLKILLGLSLVASGLAMYILAKSQLSPSGALFSAILYVYAPYKAVNAWVRGTIGESMASIFLPLVAWAFLQKKPIYLGGFLACLLLSHNLSFYMACLFLGVACLINFRVNFKIVFISLLVCLGLTAFYWLPVVTQSHNISLSKIATDYYYFENHWATARQLFISNFWGYGGSTWGPNDTMSLSIGYLQWSLPILVIIFSFFSLRTNLKQVLILCLFGFIAIFLTHGKSLFIWKLIPGFPFIQFPWRFLSFAVLFLSLASGHLSIYPKLKPVLVGLSVLTVILTANFFTSHEWKPGVTDSTYFSPTNLKLISTYAATDYWPGPKLPGQIADGQPRTQANLAVGTLTSKTSSSQAYSIYNPLEQDVIFPVGNFPKWSISGNGQDFPVTSTPDYGLVSSRLPTGSYQVLLKYSPPSISSWSILLSLASALCVLVSIKYYRQ